MTGTTTDFMKINTLPAQASPEDLLAFFGVPPDPRSMLDKNIGIKRRYWHKRTNVDNPNGRERATQMLALIQEANDAVSRGNPFEGESQAPEVIEEIDLTIRTLEEIWRVIQELVFGGDLDTALRAATAARERWPAASEPHAAFAWVIATGASDGALVSSTKLRDGIAAADMALGIDSTDLVSYESKVGLLVVLGEDDLALSAVEAAAARVQLSPQLEVYRTVSYLGAGRIDEAMTAAVGAVGRSPDDQGIRAELAEALIGQGARPLLPLGSVEAQRTFYEVVACAAWCAQGVPDVENLVRPYRLWAARSGQRVFGGSWPLRSLIGVASGFLLLPFWNRLRSETIWKVLYDGPGEEAKQDFYVVSHGEFVRFVHEGVAMPWSDESGCWPQMPNAG